MPYVHQNDDDEDASCPGVALAYGRWLGLILASRMASGCNCDSLDGRPDDIKQCVCAFMPTLPQWHPLSFS